MVETSILKAKTTTLPGLAIVLAVVMATTARAQVPSMRSFNPITDYQSNTLLRKASEQVKQGQWSEALDLYQKVIARPGESNAKLPKDDPMADPSGESELVVDARQHAQALIAALPAEALALYRSRVDAQAELWYREGMQKYDRALLRRVLDEAFASSWGDDAMNALGDMAFQDGQFAVALGYYRRIVPDRGAAASNLTYPDPEVDLARVAAKKLLCREALGSNPPSPAELQAFAAEYPDARGRMAGRDGPLSETLAQAIASDGLALPQVSDTRWPTFAGAPSRTKVAPGPVDIGRFQWSRKLEAPQPPRPIPPMTRFGGGFQPQAIVPGAAEGPLAFHPIVLGDQVVVCDENEIQAFYLNARDDDGDGESLSSSGVVAWKQPLRSQFAAPNARTGPGGTPRYTLTAQGDRIYARLGGTASSTIVAVRNNREVEGKRLWEKPCLEITLPRGRPDAPNKISGAVFEGTPVADAQSVYVALTEPVGTEVGIYVACLDAETGATRWVKSLGSATSPDNILQMMNGMGGMGGGIATITNAGNRLLSLDGQTVYYQTNLGAVAALDTETGAVRWLASYPTREGSSRSSRQANPAVIHEGLVIIAPDDALPIFAFDAATGKLVWKTDPMDSPMNKISHLLGVAQGRLIATGDRVYSFDVKTGKMLRFWPDGPSGFEGQGRGLLAGESIYWPTKTDIHVLDQATGAPGDREPIHLQRDFQVGGGNLAAGDGYLVVAQRDSLVVFAQNSRLIDRYRNEIAAHPERASAYFGLARVAEASGDDELALANLDEAIKRATPHDLFNDQPLVEEAYAKQYRILNHLASRAAASGDHATEAKRYAAAAVAARTDRDRLAARLHLASAQTRAKAPAEAVRTLQAVLDDPKLRAQTVTYDERWTVRADLWIADRLREMIKTNGDELYAEYDAKAEAMLERGRRERSARVLEEIGRAYPAARVSAEALLTLARVHEDEGNLADAARAYKKLGTMSATSDLQARALLGLARMYEQQGSILAARDALSRAQSRFGDVRLEDPESATVSSIVAERLSSPSFAALGGQRSDTSLPIPLRRVWQQTFASQVRPITVSGQPPSASSPRVLLVDRLAVRPVDPTTGLSPWTFEMDAPPVWAGYVGDRLVVASDTRIAALDPAQGLVKWQYPEDDAAIAKRVATPFAAPAGEARGVDRGNKPAGGLRAFHALGGRVFLQSSKRDLIALDGDSGTVEWTFSPISGGLNPNMMVGPRRIVAQVVDPETLVVLETETGRHREFPLADGPSPGASPQGWQRPPLAIDDDHVAVAIDPVTVAMLDVNTGERTWIAQVNSTTLPRSIFPRLIGDASRLLVLFEGNELTRLDPSTGRQKWTRPLGLEDLRDFPQALAMDSERVYCATGATLAAYDLEDAHPVWSRPLAGPKVGWSLAVADRYLTAYPNPSRTPDSPLDGMSLVVYRGDTGALVQRLAFPSRVSDLAVRLVPDGAIVATQAGAWALGDVPSVDGPRPPR